MQTFLWLNFTQVAKSAHSNGKGGKLHKLEARIFSLRLEGGSATAKSRAGTPQTRQPRYHPHPRSQIREKAASAYQTYGHASVKGATLPDPSRLFSEHA